jgi:hypothetical protein
MTSPGLSGLESALLKQSRRDFFIAHGRKMDQQEEATALSNAASARAIFLGSWHSCEYASPLT